MIRPITMLFHAAYAACGNDPITGQDYEYRRQWIEDRIRPLTSLFSIDICAYAVMSNHLHIVVKLCPEKTANWSDTDIVNRWLCLFRGPLLIQKWQAGENLSEAQLDCVNYIIRIYRKRLANLSWFMGRILRNDKRGAISSHLPPILKRLEINQKG